MGGDYYEREVFAAPVNANANQQQSACTIPPKPYSDQAKATLTQKGLHKSNDPKRFAEDERKLKSTHKHPIVFALDVSGSMGDWPMIIYDKLPMFYGQIMMQNYLTDPSLSFCAVDDTKDRAPLQVTDFGQGVQIDQLISKIYIERGGSGTEEYHEIYEMAALFYLEQCELSNNCELPYFFITGDEHFYLKVKADIVEKIMGFIPPKDIINSVDVWRELKKKFNVFHLHKPYAKGKIEQGELTDWFNALGEERILEMKTPKAVIDVILGVIALTSGARTLEGYVKDMEERGQEKERIEEVVYSLRHLTPKFLKENVVRLQEIDAKVAQKKEEKKLEMKEMEVAAAEKKAAEEEKKEEI